MLKGQRPAGISTSEDSGGLYKVVKQLKMLKLEIEKLSVMHIVQEWETIHLELLIALQHIFKEPQA